MRIIKTVGSNEKFAGKLVLVDEVEPSVWVLKLGKFIPDNERWLFAPETESALDEAMQWATNTRPRRAI